MWSPLPSPQPAFLAPATRDARTQEVRHRGAQIGGTGNLLRLLPPYLRPKYPVDSRSTAASERCFRRRPSRLSEAPRHEPQRRRPAFDLRHRQLLDAYAALREAGVEVSRAM